MGAFGDVVRLLAEMDIIQLFFPWLLILAVTYGVLEKYNVFSEDAQVNGVIALAVAFVSIGGVLLYLPAGILTNFAAALTFSVFGLLGLMILLAVAGYDVGEAMGEGDLPVGAAIVLALLSFLGAFFFTVDLGNLLGGVQNTFDEVVMPILVLVFLLLVVSATVGSSD